MVIFSISIFFQINIFRTGEHLTTTHLQQVLKIYRYRTYLEFRLELESDVQWHLNVTFSWVTCLSCMLLRNFISSIIQTEMESGEIRAKIRPPGRLSH